MEGEDIDRPLLPLNEIEEVEEEQENIVKTSSIKIQQNLILSFTYFGLNTTIEIH